MTDSTPAAHSPADNGNLQATRRRLLKTAAAAGVITGAPWVHAQEKIVLRYLGTAVNQDKAIAEKFKADTASRSSTSLSPPTTSPSGPSPHRIRST